MKVFLTNYIISWKAGKDNEENIKWNGKMDGREYLEAKSNRALSAFYLNE